MKNLDYLTIEYCDNICNQVDTFKKKIEIINGCEVIQYSYIISDNNVFEKYNAWELRGLTFVNNKRYLMLKKFFNINQTTGVMYDDVKNKQIKLVQEKADGSMIRFVNINGKIYAKSKFSFQSEQAKMAQEIYETNPLINEFVNKMLLKNLAPIFELVGPDNRIVISYPKNELVLLQVRDENTGEYYNIYNSFDKRIKRAEYINMHDLDLLISKSAKLKNIEGWVIIFNDNTIIKLKTSWYFNLHNIITNVNNSNNILSAIFNNKIDDVLSQLDENFIDIRNNINKLNSKVIEWISNTLNKITKLLKLLDTMSRKEFALEYKNNKLFSIVMRSIGKNEEEIIDIIRNYGIKITSKLHNADKFIKNVLEFEEGIYV